MPDWIVLAMNKTKPTARLAVGFVLVFRDPRSAQREPTSSWPFVGVWTARLSQSIRIGLAM